MTRAWFTAAALGAYFVFLPWPVGCGPPADTARYDGDISAEANRAFFARTQSARIRRLAIDSAGGEVEAGIELGRWVFANGLDVEVTGRCLSSCANYVFPAGRHKRVADGAIVAWHGSYQHLLETGLWRDDVAARIARTGEAPEVAEQNARARTEHLVALEHAFFREIGVDPLLCWIGKRAPYAVPDYFMLSAADLAKFNVHNVEIPPGYGEIPPARFDIDVRLIRLDDTLPGAIGAP